jgi:hypothetical protein
LLSADGVAPGRAVTPAPVHIYINSMGLAAI